MTTGWLLLLEDDTWQAVQFSADGMQSHRLGQTEAVAAALAALIDSDGRGSVGIALPAAACLSSTISLDGLPKQQRDTAMQYRCEEVLPLAVEDLTVEFLTQEEQALAVAVETARWLPLCESLREQGIELAWLTPVAWLAWESLSLSEAADIVLWQHPDGIELYGQEPGKLPHRWQHLPTDSQALGRELRLAALQSTEPLRIALMCSEAELPNVLEASPDWQLVVSETRDFRQAAAEHAGQLLARQETPQLNLAQEALAPGPWWQQLAGSLSVLAAAVVLFLLSFSGVMLWRAAQYDQQARELEAQQREVFVQCFPEIARVPVNVRARLQSELRQIQGLKGAGNQVPDTPSALLVLRSALANLPGQVRFRILDIRIQGDRLELDGEARSFSDADSIASALRSSGEFEVEPVQTFQLPQTGVGFSLTARWRTADTKEAAG